LKDMVRIEETHPDYLEETQEKSDSAASAAPATASDKNAPIKGATDAKSSNGADKSVVALATPTERLLNFYKVDLIYDVLKELQRSQVLPYPLEPDMAIQTWLGQASDNVLNPEDSYQLSMQIEPPSERRGRHHYNLSNLE